MPKRKLQRKPALRHDKRMNESCFLLNYYTAGKTAGLASGCVFCSVRASMIRHSRKLALRLKHFARWRKLARTSLRKPRHYRPACSFCLRNARLRFLFAIKAFMRLSCPNSDTSSHTVLCRKQDFQPPAPAFPGQSQFLPYRLRLDQCQSDSPPS